MFPKLFELDLREKKKLFISAVIYIMVYALISIWSDKNVDYAMEFMLFYLVLVMFGRKIKMSWVVGIVCV